ncbi:MAG TPA: PASTA domain-containing protein [Longimicrobium sp.]|nr:PASTA domain-containing protein [Longimicrobium sp.]
MSIFDTAPLLDALSAPLGALIAAVGRGVADAQREMDAASIAALEEIYASNQGLFLELQRIGYRPTWYQIPEVESELQIALTVTGGETTGSSATGTPRVRLYAAPVDAGYASRFNFSLQASSRVRFRIVPVPPSTATETLRVVPALVGLTLGDARTRLLALDLPATLPAAADTVLVTAQTPAPGTVLASGQTVSLTA